MKNESNKSKKVAVGMSGGVDSSLTAALLVEQGHEVAGVFLEAWRAPGCRVDEDRRDAMDVALSLGIPFTVLDVKEEYRQKVVDYFYEEYKAGRTPNPDVMCNREIKFGIFYEWAMRNGFDAVATGHYARVQSTQETRSPSRGGHSKQPSQSRAQQDTRFQLLRGLDGNKDQSYFLYQLREEQLEHVLFPMGGMTKPQVREAARERNLLVAEKPDSQGICFIGEISTEQFLKDLGMEEERGDVVVVRDGEQWVVGEHHGAWFFTVGQRIGLKNPDSKALQEAGLNPSQLPALYVLAKDVKINRLLVGEREDLFTREFEVGELHFISDRNSIATLQNEKSLRVRIRNLGEMLGASIEEADGSLRVTLEQPVFGVAPGQAAVFYKDDRVLGGGVIQ